VGAVNLGEPRTLTFLSALDVGMAEEMRRDDRVFVMATNPPPAITDEFGAKRSRRMPISEAAITGIAVGAAVAGLRPIVMWRNITFGFVAFDQVANQAAKLRYMAGGQRAFPIVYRAYGGGGLRLAAQHSQSPYAIYAHMPGLKVVVPSNAADALGLVKAAIRDDDPVICFEASRLDATTSTIPAGDHIVPLGQARVCRAGTDITIVAIGAMVPVALAAADQLQTAGISVEVIDPRSVVPLDRLSIVESVCKTRRLLVVDEAPSSCSVAAEVAASVAEHADAFAALAAPVVRLCGAATPVPYSPVLEDAVFPNVERVFRTVSEMLALTAKT
jgi:pyruvate/2-oxoglutarate/acetoin dehydrogenase E1 component